MEHCDRLDWGIHSWNWQNQKDQRPLKQDWQPYVILFYHVFVRLAPAGASPQLCTSWMKTEWQKWTEDWCDPGVKHWVSRNVTVIWLHLFTDTVTQYSSIFIFLKLIMLPKRGYVLHSWRPPQNSSIHPDVWKEEERRDCSRRGGASGKRNGIAWILLTFKNYTDVWVPKETTSGLCLFINYIRWDNWKCSWLKTLLLLAASILTGI